MSADNVVDINVNQKASFSATFTVKQNGSILDLTTYTAAAKYKQNFTDSDSSAQSFTAEVTNAAAGQVTVSLTPTQTSNLQIQPYKWDLVITNTGSGFKTRIVEGVMRVSGGVT